MRFECQVQGTGLPVLYTFDHDSLSELGMRVNEHLRDGLITHAEALDVLEWADEMVSGYRNLGVLLKAVDWRRERNAEKLRGK